jgi:hypothetical protein
VHFNLSFNGEKNLNDLNILKLIKHRWEWDIQILSVKKGNVYAKTIKKIIPYKEYDF